MKNLYTAQTAKFLLENLQIEANRSEEDINNLHAGIKDFSVRVDELNKQLQTSFDALELVKNHINGVCNTKFLKKLDELLCK
jgi:hypothetical protein